MTLDDAIRAFARKHPRFADSAVARDSTFASQRFLQFLEENNVITSAKPAVRTFHRSNGFEGYPIPVNKVCEGECLEHHVVQIGGRFIDFTVRRFSPRAPFPLVWEKIT